MTDISARKEGRIGRITLQRPQALNAVTYDMIQTIDAALEAWADDDDVRMVLIDAKGERAFSAGGDLQSMYTSAMDGNYEYGRTFWQDEYRTNAKIFEFPKPYVALMQGFTMGGGVGVSCHGSHRVVCETSQIAMPECAVGLVPDVGGSLLLARAPGRLGEYLGATGTRMGPGDAIHAGFADYFIPQADWPALTTRLIETGDWAEIDRMAHPAPDSPLAQHQDQINALFAGDTAADILRGLDDSDLAQRAEAGLRKGCPLSVCCTIELVRRSRGMDAIRPVLAQEYRFTARSASEGDFIEGIRAAIIDKDRTPNWQHDRIEDVSRITVANMLKPLGDNELTF